MINPGLNISSKTTTGRRQNDLLSLSAPPSALPCKHRDLKVLR